MRSSLLLLCIVFLSGCSQSNGVSLPAGSNGGALSASQRDLSSFLRQPPSKGVSYKVLYDFGDVPDGIQPDGNLVDVGGTLYGTTYDGGTYRCGTVFSLDMGLDSFVASVRPAGKVGQTGGILGQAFKGTSNVSLNGTPASFKVLSNTFIESTVPAGGTTGFFTVTTPSGTLTSNVPFQVIP